MKALAPACLVCQETVSTAASSAPLTPARPQPPLRAQAPSRASRRARAQARRIRRAA